MQVRIYIRSVPAVLHAARMLGVPGAVISRASKENKGHAALEGREVYYTVLLGEGESRREEERSHDLYINRYSGPWSFLFGKNAGHRAAASPKPSSRLDTVADQIHHTHSQSMTRSLERTSRKVGASAIDYPSNTTIIIQRYYMGMHVVSTRH